MRLLNQKNGNQEKVMRVAAYVRVSTEEQAQTGYSIEAQKEKLAAFCTSQDMQLSRIYADEGFSGKDTKRPDLQQLLRDAELSKFDLLLVYKLDRLSRRLGDLVSIGEMFDKLGVGIRSCTEPFDTTNPTGKLLFNMLGSFAQFERELIGERTKLGLRRRRMEGKWSGLPPFGYELLDSGILKPLPLEARIVRQIFKLSLDFNLGTEMIARKLRREDQTSRKKGRWGRSTIWSILTNPIYAGLIQVDGEYRKGSHEPIIPMRDFEKVQLRLREKQNTPPRSSMSPNILVGLVKCGNCKSAMTTAKGKKRYYYYACRGRANGCKTDYVPARPLESAVLSEIKKIASMPELINSYLTEFAAKNESEKKEILSHIMSLRRRLEAAEKYKKEKADWLIENAPDKESVRFITQQIQDKIDEQKKIQEELAQLEVKSDRLHVEGITSEIVCDFLKRFEDMYENLETGQKRLLVQSLVREVVVKDRNECQAVLTIPLQAMPHTQNGNSPSEINKIKGNSLTSYPFYPNWGG